MGIGSLLGRNWNSSSAMGAVIQGGVDAKPCSESEPQSQDPY